MSLNLAADSVRLRLFEGKGPPPPPPKKKTRPGRGQHTQETPDAPDG